jgi:hypothetical protein
MEWVRGDLVPPMQLVYRDGKDYQLPYTLAVGEEEDLPSAEPGTTTVTIPIAASLDDRHVTKTGSTYGTLGSATWDSANMYVKTVRSSASGVEVTNGLLKFDTSIIPDAATVDAATLRGYVENKASAYSLDLRGEYYEWDGSSASDHQTLATHGTTAFSPVRIASLYAGSLEDMTLENLSNIEKTGFTYIRLHITGTEPGGFNFVWFAAYDHTGDPEMKLIVTYTV